MAMKQDLSTREEKVIESTTNVVTLENTSIKSADAGHVFEYDIEDEEKKQNDDCEKQEQEDQEHKEKGWFGRFYSRHKTWFR